MPLCANNGLSVSLISGYVNKDTRGGGDIDENDDK